VQSYNNGRKLNKIQEVIFLLFVALIKTKLGKDTEKKYENGWMIKESAS